MSVHFSEKTLEAAQAGQVDQADYSQAVLNSLAPGIAWFKLNCTQKSLVLPTDEALRGQVLRLIAGDGLRYVIESELGIFPDFDSRAGVINMYFSAEDRTAALTDFKPNFAQQIADWVQSYLQQGWLDPEITDAQTRACWLSVFSDFSARQWLESQLSGRRVAFINCHRGVSFVSAEFPDVQEMMRLQILNQKPELLHC